jgi:hypothetical protein
MQHPFFRHSSEANVMVVLLFCLRSVSVVPPSELTVKSVGGTTETDLKQNNHSICLDKNFVAGVRVKYTVTTSGYLSFHLPISNAVRSNALDPRTVKLALLLGIQVIGDGHR